MSTSPRLLVCIITGGRPKTEQRPTARWVQDLLGVAEAVEYVLREDHDADYEVEDGVARNPYSVEWADSFARSHWRHPRAVFQPGGFHGAFTGREWAMRSAQYRGFDLVLQLDDNIRYAGTLNCTRSRTYPFVQVPDLVRIGRDLVWSTNVMMGGFQLNSALTPKMQQSLKTIRPGYPYSFFFEKTGPGRMPYYGPFEDDIMHALEYALNGGPHRTAAVIDAFSYLKESKSKTGMRGHYNAERGLEIAGRYPRNVVLRESKRTNSPSEPSSERGVRHLLNTRGFTPVRIRDREVFTAAQADLVSLVRQSEEALHTLARAKIARRAGLTPSDT